MAEIGEIEFKLILQVISTGQVIYVDRTGELETLL